MGNLWARLGPLLGQLALLGLLMAARAEPAAPPAWIGPLTVAEVIAGDQLRLADGRIVRLAGIRVPDERAGGSGAGVGAQAGERLGRELERATIRLALAQVGADRYGRVVAQVERDDGLWLQGMLLERGLAQVQTRPGEVARAERMLALEDQARGARRGLWADPTFAIRDASALTEADGGFAIIQGKVARVAPSERFVYLNFGADWRRDFTVRIDKKVVRELADAGLDVTTLAGRRIEIRGVVLEAAGPLIELSHPEQMRLLP
jgi:micrococcal nuclease